MTTNLRPILLAGPTASGKSALAMMLAELSNGCVINADALQVYDLWRVLTARPSEADERRVPHRLYGHVPVSTPDYSVGRWLRELDPILAECAKSGCRPIIVGGTGLYFKALSEGLAEIPETPPPVRTELKLVQKQMGEEAFYTELKRLDPETAEQIDQANPRRVLRAREVFETTGEGLATWRARTPPPLIPLEDARAFVLEPPRETLRAGIAQRFDVMLKSGALEEVARLRQLGFDEEDFARLPGLKALGAPELLAHLAGETDLDTAIDRAVTATRQYAKRQSTWARNQMSAWARVELKESSKIDPKIVAEMLN
ncbi:MAG: tRNA (adenosine(37)-N6)-dimethylallyltransferase MiaA [Pseudomonadota bacterium]